MSLANNSNQINYNHVLHILQDYMITTSFIDKSLSYIDPSSHPVDSSSHPVDSSSSVDTKCEHISLKIEDQIVVPPLLNLFYPKEKDALFWCYFIIKNGHNAYQYPYATSFVAEKEVKFKCIELLRSHKQEMKTHKIKCIKEDVEDELINKERIGMKTFIALCLASENNVLFIHKRKCFDLVSTMAGDAKTHIVVCDDNIRCPSKYGVQIDASLEQLAYYRENYFNWESVDKPLKAMGSYKSEELAVLCKKIGLDFTSGQKTKKEMYELLIFNM